MSTSYVEFNAPPVAVATPEADIMSLAPVIPKTAADVPYYPPEIPTSPNLFSQSPRAFPIPDEDIIRF